jgi:hypothetical protein
MKKLQTAFACMALILILAGLMLSTGIAYAQDMLPPQDPEESWIPSEGDGASFAAPGVDSKYDTS